MIEIERENSNLKFFLFWGAVFIVIALGVFVVSQIIANKPMDPNGPAIYILESDVQNPQVNANGGNSTYLLFTVVGDELDPKRDAYIYYWNLTDWSLSVDAYLKDNGPCEVVASNQILCEGIAYEELPESQGFTYEISLTYVNAEQEQSDWAAVITQEGGINLETGEHELYRLEGAYFP